MTDWQQTSHCSWQSHWWSVLKEYCPARGGVVYRLCRLGRPVGDFKTIEEARSKVREMEADA